MLHTPWRDCPTWQNSLCFMLAGGYDTARYWTPAGWQWRHGQGENSGPVEELVDVWRIYQRDPSLIAQRRKAGQMTPDNADTWGQLIQLSEEEARQLRDAHVA